MSRLERLYANVRAALTGHVHALPVDAFRVLAGGLSVAYFVQAFWEIPDISAPSGLIDHQLTREIFWYTRWSLFPPGLDTPSVQVVFGGAIAASVLLTVGYRPKLMAGYLFLVASSAYRWNFLVIFVDDGVFHLVVFWVLLLPVGRTLTLKGWLDDRAASWERWKTVRVPAAAVHCFIANLALLYVAAGLWKLASPMWRDGTALYAILRLPLSYAPDFWQPSWLPALKVGSYVALVSEPLIPVMFYLRRHHPLKYAHLALFLGLHLGILATLKVPYANVACLAALVLIFREELMGWVVGSGETALVPTGGRTREPQRIRRRHLSPAGPRSPAATARIGTTGKLSVVFVAVLTLATLGEATLPEWRVPERSDRNPGVGVTHNVLYYPLWVVGIAQSYRLMDWIDERNFTVRYEVRVTGPEGHERQLPSSRLFPGYAHSVLLQAYLNDVTWGKLPADRVDAVKDRLRRGYANRFCRKHGAEGLVTAHATIYRVDADNLELSRGEGRLVMAFECHGAVAQLVERRASR